MLHPKTVFNGTYELKTYDINAQKQLTLPALVRIMHEASMQNVIDLGVSVWDLEPYHISWVLLKQRIHLYQIPHLGQTLSIHTYPSGFERIYTYRDTLVYNEREELVADAASTWLLMDTQTRRLSAIPGFILAYEIPDFLEILPRAQIELASLKETKHTRSYCVGYHDLDFNGHLSNILYLQWMLECLPDAILQSGKIISAEIQFKHEARWNDAIVAEAQCTDNGTFYHQLTRKTDGKLLALAKTEWEREDEE